MAAVPAAQLDPAAGFVSAFELLGNHQAAAVVAVTGPKTKASRLLGPILWSC